MKKSTKKGFEMFATAFAASPMALLGGIGTRKLFDEAKTTIGKIGALAFGVAATGAVIYQQDKAIAYAVNEHFEALEEEESYSYIDFDQVHKVES